MRVAVVGAGYVGLTTGLALTYLGHEVTAAEKDRAKVDILMNGKSPIHEAGLGQMLSLVRDRFHVSDSTSQASANADAILICVGTPPKHNGEANTRYVEEAAREIACGLMHGLSYTVVIKSTVPIGTNRRVSHVMDEVLRDRGVEASIYVAANPEFLREGAALSDTLYPDRIVVGADQPEAVETVRRLYRGILEQTFVPPAFLPRPERYGLPPLITTDPTSAEVIKYAANAFLALKISFINEIAGLTERVGASVVEVARGIGSDPRIGSSFLGAGIGWGGSCFPKDTSALLAVASEYGYSMPIVEACRLVNMRQRQIVVDKLQSVLKVLRGRTIAVLGLAFKPNTDDVRESPPLDIIRMLSERGAHVRACDPVAIRTAKPLLETLEVEFCSSPLEAATNADAVVLATEWEEYRSLDLGALAKVMRSPILVDGRNLYEPASAASAGMVYLGVGR